MKKIVIDENIPFIKGVLEPFFDVVYCKGVEINALMVKDAAALVVRTRTRCNCELLEGSSVEFIGTATIGYDHIDTQYVRKFATASGCNARAVMQYVASALAHLSRSEGWSPSQKTLGVVGMGNVGTLVAEFGRKMGFKVVCCDPPKMLANKSLGYCSLGEVLEQSDIVTLHVPLNETGQFKTMGMADSAFFKKMRSGATFINSSRGPVVDDNALCAAIETGKVGAAVIDVWNGEPNINSHLLSLAKYATPHIAGYSLQGKANATSMIVRALAAHFGLPLLDWYPPDAPKQVIDNNITWKSICSTIDNYYNIESDVLNLRSNPENFESLRNNYKYREEYF